MDKIAKVMREEQTAQSSGGLAQPEVCAASATVPEVTKLSSLKLAWAWQYNPECSPIHKQPHRHWSVDSTDPGFA